jgi:hypothetical protein
MDRSTKHAATATKPRTRSAGRLGWRLVSSFLLGLSLLPGASRAGQLPGNRWDLLAIVYPPDRDVGIEFGGGEKTLTSKGLAKVKAKKDSASLEIEVKGLPAPGEIGWTGRQYVLWAFDREKRAVNLGQVPLRSKSSKWSVSVPFRAFGLLVTAEKDSKATAPSAAVALESLLPTDPDLVVPLYRVELELAPPQD